MIYSAGGQGGYGGGGGGQQGEPCNPSLSVFVCLSLPIHLCPSIHASSFHPIVSPFFSSFTFSHCLPPSLHLRYGPNSIE